MHRAIRKHWDDAFGATVPTVHDNAPDRRETKDLFAHFTVISGDSDQKSLGHSPRVRTTGIASINLYSPSGEDDSAVLALADRIRDEFSLVTVTGEGGTVVFQAASLKPMGRVGGWWQVNVSCPFYSDHIFTTE